MVPGMTGFHHAAVPEKCHLHFVLSSSPPLQISAMAAGTIVGIDCFAQFTKSGASVGKGVSAVFASVLSDGELSKG